MLKSIVCAVLLALAPLSAAATTVTPGGSYDINSDSLFSGSVVPAANGAGSYSVTFFSLVDPTPASANVLIFVPVLKSFTGLTMSWWDSATNAVLSTTAVTPVTALSTVFTSPNLSQNLVFSWSSGPKNVGFNFNVAVAPVPVPAAGLLLLTAFAGLGAMRMRRKAA